MLNLTTMVDLKGLLPTTIINTEIDLLALDREKLKPAGMISRSKYKDVAHEFFGLDTVVADVKSALDVAARDLKASFGAR